MEWLPSEVYQSLAAVVDKELISLLLDKEDGPVWSEKRRLIKW